MTQNVIHLPNMFVGALYLSNNWVLNITHYSWGTECELVCTEHPRGYWHNNVKASIDIDKETACAMIKYLTKFVNDEGEHV